MSLNPQCVQIFAQVYMYVELNSSCVNYGRLYSVYGSMNSILFKTVRAVIMSPFYHTVQAHPMTEHRRSGVPWLNINSGVPWQHWHSGIPWLNIDSGVPLLNTDSDVPWLNTDIVVYHDWTLTVVYHDNTDIVVYHDWTLT